MAEKTVHAFSTLIIVPDPTAAARRFLRSLGAKEVMRYRRVCQVQAGEYNQLITVWETRSMDRRTGLIEKHGKVLAVLHHGAWAPTETIVMAAHMPDTENCHRLSPQYIKDWLC